MDKTKNQSDQLESLNKFLKLVSEKLKNAEAKTDVEQVVTELNGILLDSDVQQAYNDLMSDE